MARYEPVLRKNWEEFESKAKPPLVYDPPQLKLRFSLNVAHRSPWGAWPVVPCCCAGVATYCVSVPCCGMKIEKLSEPDAWFERMLKTGTSANCPEHLKGVWWMKDNIAGEVLVTFHDMDWRTDRVGIKYARYNWTVDADTLWGSVLGWKMHFHTFQISPNSQWIDIGEGQWIYVPQPGEKLVRPDGTELPMLEGNELIRVSYDNDDPTSEVTYQYRVRRVAYLGADGNLVKTPIYDELRQEALMPSVRGVCCDYGYCNIKDEDAAKVWVPLSDRQGVIYAKPPPQVAMGEGPPAATV